MFFPPLIVQGEVVVSPPRPLFQPLALGFTEKVIVIIGVLRYHCPATKDVTFDAQGFFDPSLINLRH